MSQSGTKRARPGPGGRASSGNLICPVLVGTTAAVVGDLVSATVGAVVGAVVGGKLVGTAVGTVVEGKLVGTAVSTAVGVGKAEQPVVNISNAMTPSMSMTKGDGIGCINLVS